MTVDFAAMKAKAKGSKEEGMCAVILGAGQAGKSTLIGTLGVPTLIIHTADESHSVTSAKIFNKEITGLCINDGCGPDEAMQKLDDILSSPDLFDHFKAVAIDSFSSIEMLIKQTAWLDNFCKSSSGKRDKYREPEAVLTRLQSIINTASDYRKKGGHVICTLPCHVKSQDGDGMAEVVEPVLSTYGTANAVPRMFSTVLLVSHTQVDGEIKRALVFDTKVQKVSKDLGGNVKKLLNFAPCVRGLSDEDTPTAFPPDLKKLVEFIKEAKK